MQPEEIIKTAAAEQGLRLLANPVLSPDDSKTYYVILDRSSPQSKIKALKNNLESKAFSLEIGYYGEGSDTFRNALIESVNKVFGPQIDALTVLKAGGVYQVLVLAESSSEDLSDQIETHVNDVRRLFDDPPVSVKVELNVRKPTAIEFLSSARRKAPVSCDTMQTELSSRGFADLSLDWINHQFDRLRKANLLHRQPNRTYVLTQAGLRALGSGKGRNSPDVVRLLDLARGRK